MNVIKKLENMNMYQLQKICQKVNVPCPKTKRNVIQALLNPLKMKYKMKHIKKKHIKKKHMTVNEKMLQDLHEYREQKKSQKKSVRRGFNKKRKCYNEIQNVNKIHNAIQRDIFLKNPVSKHQHQRQHNLLKYRTKILKECLQGKKSSNVRP